MVSLVEVTESNFTEICNLKVADDQITYVSTPLRILASAYAMRDRNARVWAIAEGNTLVGLLMVKDLYEEPACYAIEQFLVDYRHQNMGYGSRALRLVIDILSKERRYEAIEVCVKMENKQAIKVYMNAGFIDTGFIDPSVPDSYCLRYDFK